jgi:hypothetical protein
MEEDVSAPYLVRFFTSDVSGAGTDAKVSIVIYGDEGKTDEYDLANKTDNFERGRVDDFKLACHFVGHPHKLRISAFGGGMTAAWHLEKVEVHELGKALIYTFQHGDWIKKGSKSKPTMVELPLYQVERVDDDGREIVTAHEDLASKVTYKVIVNTGDQRNAGTDANVYLNIFGTKGDSGERHLKQSATHTNKFQRNSKDEFEIEVVDLGDLIKVKV